VTLTNATMVPPELLDQARDRSVSANAMWGMLGQQPIVRPPEGDMLLLGGIIKTETPMLANGVGTSSG
jgi:hypothetical protein